MIKIEVHIEKDEDALAEFMEHIGWEPGDGSDAEAIVSEITDKLLDNGLLAGCVIIENTKED